LSSTYSSSEQGRPRRSATEALSSRYRKLFVLPPTLSLLLYAVVVSILLVLLSRGASGGLLSLPSTAVLVLSAAAVSSALFIADPKTIASFRRTTAVLVAGEVLWLPFAACGAIYAQAGGPSNALTNAIVFGAFVCAGFEFLVINGAFSRSTSLAFLLSSIHPVAMFVTIRWPEFSAHPGIPAVALGVVAFAIVAVFTVFLKTKKTSRGHDALSLFHAFMKTWAAGDSSELEAIISDHSEEAEVTTKVLRLQSGSGDLFIVLPGVHPGPFHPVGSYDLPGYLSRAFEGLGPAMTLHRPGGHEGNLATKAEALRYSAEVSDFARSIVLAKGKALLRGPEHAQVGKVQAGAMAFSDDLLLTISFAPLGSDDLSASVESELEGPGRAAGFDVSVVDAHNSIDHQLESPDTGEPGWRLLFDSMKRAEARPFRVAYSHSGDLNFKGGAGDLTENGVSLLMVEAGDVKSVLILADANNAVPGLKAEVARALDASGYRLIELCTSDSHNLAARGLTVARGYQALGESTPTGSIAQLAVGMARLAEARLAPAAYGSGRLISRVKVFGSKALNEFAEITQSSSNLARRYTSLAAPSIVVMFVLSLML
jgi:putative membrane protein